MCRSLGWVWLHLHPLQDLGGLTNALTTFHVWMWQNSPTGLASMLFTHSGNLLCLSFSVPSSLVCLFIFLFVLMFLICLSLLSLHQPSCHNSSHAITHYSAAFAFIYWKLRKPNYHLQQERKLASIGWESSHSHFFFLFTCERKSERDGGKRCHCMIGFTLTLVSWTNETLRNVLKTVC